MTNLTDYEDFLDGLEAKGYDKGAASRDAEVAELTARLSDVTAALETARTTLTSATQVINDLKTQVEDLTVKLASAQASLSAEKSIHAADNKKAADALAALQATFDKYKADNPPAKQKTLIGAWSTRKSGETLTQAFARFESTCGPVQVARVYDSNAGPAKVLSEARLAGLGTRAIVASFKLPPANVPSGLYDQTITDTIKAFSAERNGFPVFIAYEHEADSKVQGGSYTAAQFRTAWTRVMGLVSAVGDPGIKRNLILTGYDFSNRIGNFYVPGTVDVIGIDPYSYKAADDASFLMNYAGQLDWCKANNLPMAIAEVGQHADDDASHLALVKSYQEFIDAGMVYVCHYNSIVNNEKTGIPDNFEIHDRPTCAAAFKALPRA